MASSQLYYLAKSIDMKLNKQVREALNILDKGETFTFEELREFKALALRQLVNYTFHFVPYYRRVFDEIGLIPSDIINVEDIQYLPVLTKDQIRNAGDDLKSVNLDTYDYVVTRSGGTTGEPIKSYVNRLARALGTYAARRGQQWMGWEPGMPIVNLFGGSLGMPEKFNIKAKLRDYSIGRIFLPAFELNRNNASDYLAVLRKNAPCVINGYSSVVYNLALYAEELDFKSPDGLIVFTTAELLPDQWKLKIGEVFNAPVRSYYGCGEVNSLGFQVGNEVTYIVPDEHVIIDNEFPTISRPENNPLLITPLFNFAQPLIRYKLGDNGIIVNGNGNDNKRDKIIKLEGRDSDMLTIEGKSISPSIIPHIVSKSLLRVKKYQLIQYAQYEFEFRFEPSEFEISDRELKTVEDILKTHLSEKIQVKFINTQEFIVSPLGKFRIVLNKINKV